MSPSNFVPSVSQTGGDGAFVQATQVAPEKNFAPQQIEQMGQAVGQLGGAEFRTGQSMARMAADTIDDANVKMAETQMLTNATQITRSYLQTVGKGATDAYPQAQQDLAKAKQDAAANLTNPIQQRMYNQAAQQHLISFGGQMADHNHQQTVAYGANAALARSDMQGQQAVLNYRNRDAVDKDGNPTGDYSVAWNTAIQEAENAAQLAYGAPPGSPRSREMVQKATSRIVGGVVASLINDHASAEAQVYFDKEHALGNIDDETFKQLGNMIRTQAERDQIVDNGDDMIKDQLASHKAPAPGANQPVVIQPVEGGSITSTMGPPRPGGRTHNGIDIAVPVGTPIKAPTDGTVTKVWDDTEFGGGHSMEITLPDGSVVGFAHLSSTNYKVGQAVTQGQVVAQSGDSTGGDTHNVGPHVHWMMKDPNGQYIDPRTYGGVPPKLESFTDPNDLEAIEQRIDASNLSPYMRREQKTYVQSQYRRYRQMDDQQYEDLKKGVVDNWYAVDGDVSKFTPPQLAQFSQLRPGDQAQLRKGIPRESDEDTVLNLIAHPDLVVPGSIEKYRDQLSKGDYRSFFKQAIDNATPDSPKVRAVSMDNDQFDSILNSNGLGKLVSPKPNTPESGKRIDWITTIRDRIDEAQTKAGGEIDRTAKAKIINDVIGEKMTPTYVAPSGFESFTRSILPWTPAYVPGTGDTTPYMNLTPSQAKRAYAMVDGQQVMLDSIPKDFRDAAAAELQKRGQPVTPTAIAKTWLHNQQKKPQQ